MTAYGRASGDFPFGKLLVEIQSVNRKFLDVLIYLPKDLFRFDIAVRKWVAEQIERGQVTVRISCTAHDQQAHVQSYLPKLKYLQKEWNHVAQALGFDPVNLPFLVGQLEEGDVLEIDEAAYSPALQQVVEAALKECLQMKRAEGDALAADIQKRLHFIAEKLRSVEERKEIVLEKYRKKISERLLEFGQMTPDLEEKILRELVILAERIDVTEEHVRLQTHIEQFKKQLQMGDKAVGRSLEFLTQEMLREINTLGSKSMDTEVSSIVIMAKSELEKIREQILNIE